MTSVKLPRLLDASGNEAARLNPASLSIELSMNQVSTADMTVEMSDTVIPIRAWIELYTIHGSAGIFRVSQMDTDYDRDEQRLSLEHGLCALNDAILSGDEEQGKTPSEWLNTILAKQTVKRGNTNLWAKGTVAPTSTVYLTPNDATLLDILSSMMEQLPDYMLVTDQSVFPWTISITAKPSSVTAEGRLSRNLSSVRVSYDDTDLCTRVYANGLTGGHLDASTASTYGIVEQYLYLDEDTSAADAARLATHYLNKRKEPQISVELDMVDLYESTGENWDKLTLGKKFRLALPSYGVTVNQWITGVNYGDVYGDPEHVTITLANEVADLAQRMAKTEEVAQTARTVGDINTGRIGSTQKTVEIHDTKLEKTDSYIKFLDDEGVTVWRDTTASVEVGDAFAAMKAQVTDTYGNITSKSDIVQKLRTAGVTVDATKSLVDIYATEQINRKTATETNAASISVNANAITTKVSKDGVISSINQTAEAIQISTSKVNLSGYVTSTYFDSVINNLDWTDTDTLLVTRSFTIASGSSVTILGHSVEWNALSPVTSISVSSDTQSNIAITYDGSTVAGGRQFNYVKSVTFSKTPIHFLGYID